LRIDPPDICDVVVAAEAGVHVRRDAANRGGERGQIVRAARNTREYGSRCGLL
jgi:hypothetical protein